MKKALLVNLPRYDTIAPSSAMGILAGLCENHDWDYDIVDISYEIKSRLTVDENFEIDNWLTFIIPEIKPETEQKLLDIWRSLVVDVANDYNLVCASIFTYWTLPIARLFLTDYQENIAATTPIVTGGNGTLSAFPDTKQRFYDWATENKIVDYVIVGEAETPFTELLKGNTTGPGINNENFIQEENLDRFPLPSYKKFNMSNYSGTTLYVTGSRGCVRRCTFCDIQNMWPKFRFRSAESLVQEIVKHYYETGIERYEFTDSLINGSTSNFYKFNSLLAEEKAKNNDLKNINYVGQAIVRPKNQMPEYHYEAMYHAGCRQVTIGIESFSESVRDHMLKKFSNEDIMYHAQQCSYWGIRNVWLMIVGYPTETIEDHMDNMRGLETYKKYAQQGIIELMRWGTSMHLIEDTPIADPQMLRDLEINKTHQSSNSTATDWHYNWVSNKNPSLDLKERIRRRMELHYESVRLGYPQPRVIEELKIVNALADHI